MAPHFFLYSSAGAQEAVLLDMMESLNVTPSRKGVAYSYAVRSRALALYEQGMKSNRIASETGVDPSVIRRWIRRYRTYGDNSLQPYWHSGGISDPSIIHLDKDAQFRKAYRVYATTLEPVAGITRRYGLEYHAFKYHVERYHPELVAARESLKVAQ